MNNFVNKKDELAPNHIAHKKEIKHNLIDCDIATNSPNTIVSSPAPKNKTICHRYSTILLDPPWDLQQKGHWGASQHYDLMTIEQIKGLPIPDLLGENSHVWMWTTNAALPYAFDILKHWGLTYRSPFYYCKTKMGLGTYLRNASEPLLLATRGKAPVSFHAQMNWNIYPVLNHSHKPEEIFDMIERLSPGPYLEMFARRPHPHKGWHVWGAEIPSDVVIPGYPVPEYTEKAGSVSPEDIAPPGMFKSSKPKPKRKQKEG